MEFTIKTSIQATPEQIYSAWLSSAGHSEMTGGTATASDKLGDLFTAWDGYISGKNLLLEKNRKIVQSWRTTEFKEESADSVIEIHLAEKDRNTEITLIHSNLQEGDEHYEKGWEEHYFKPMRAYFFRNQ